MNRREILVESVQALLGPVMRFCIRHSIHFPEISEALRTALISAADRELRKHAEHSNVSRIAAMTGLHRREVTRIYARKETKPVMGGVVTRVIGQWSRDPRFMTRSGTPRVLKFLGPQSEFHELVATVSRELNAATVLFELERSGAVEKVKKGLKLVARTYIPKGDMRESLQLLSADTDDLISGVSQNIFDNPNPLNLHTKTQFDNVDPGALLELRNWILREGSSFHFRLRNFLSRFDRDINPNAGTTSGRARVAIASFSLVEVQAEDKDEKREI